MDRDLETHTAGELRTYTTLGYVEAVTTGGHVKDQRRGMDRKRPAEAIIQGPFSPIPPMELRAKRINTGIYLLTDLGLEKRCSRCCDHWPADTEFFMTKTNAPDGLLGWCKACWLEWRYPDRYCLGAAPSELSFNSLQIETRAQ